MNAVCDHCLSSVFNQFCKSLTDSTEKGFNELLAITVYT